MSTERKRNRTGYANRHSSLCWPNPSFPPKHTIPLCQFLFSSCSILDHLPAQCYLFSIDSYQISFLTTPYDISSSVWYWLICFLFSSFILSLFNSLYLFLSDCNYELVIAFPLVTSSDRSECRIRLYPPLNTSYMWRLRIQSHSLLPNPGVKVCFTVLFLCVSVALLLSSHSSNYLSSMDWLSDWPFFLIGWKATNPGRYMCQQSQPLKMKVDIHL